LTIDIQWDGVEGDIAIPQIVLGKFRSSNIFRVQETLLAIVSPTFPQLKIIPYNLAVGILYCKPERNDNLPFLQYIQLKIKNFGAGLTKKN